MMKPCLSAYPPNGVIFEVPTAAAGHGPNAMSPGLTKSLNPPGSPPFIAPTAMLEGVFALITPLTLSLSISDGRGWRKAE